MTRQKNKSFWSDTATRAPFDSLTEDATCEVAVLGAGIVGILTAWLLVKEGKQVTLIEAHRVADGVSAYTTAKVTSQHSYLYQTLLQYLGKEKASTYYEANEVGLSLIRQTIEELAIDCDFEEKDAVIYATTDMGKKKVMDEMKAYQKIGINGYLSYDIPDFPFPIKVALGIPGQAQFHPVKFMLGVLDEFIRLGGNVYEHTRALEVKNKEKQEVLLEHGNTLTADQVVIATHYPINDEQGLFFARLEVNRSYGVLGVPTKKIPMGMYINAESPSRSFRSVIGENGEELLLVVGDDHFTGRGDNMPEHYENLKTYAEDSFGVTEFTYQWSTQDPTTPDKVPYIGQMHQLNKNIFIATGFNKWGMSQGATAAQLLTDLIVKRGNPYEKLYAPTRSHLNPLAVGRLAKDNTLIGKELIGGKIAPSMEELEEVGLGEGALVKINGERVGVYRDETGILHKVSPVCTHMGCTVNWNQAERSWDCPCHGSRFDYEGEVLEGPAVKPLPKK
ncbi:FAD-dependent oxidoreductase [Jeotgalibaca caeni]|uniref:FAD-dependent oxidoreductase n=1 Tax=Jeotgalibaca caeni TaxID=3028623 RepID=UPI00237D9AE2|nr:FAD-dependent oxidoreductase [Jeotgalibaca caeni]MDE1549748.1 FAD-dependent oxidoreductase [Jeotgalibaca caeni]